MFSGTEDELLWKAAICCLKKKPGLGPVIEDEALILLVAETSQYYYLCWICRFSELHHLPISQLRLGVITQS